jgi:hypothetical protein
VVPVVPVVPVVVVTVVTVTAKDEHCLLTRWCR